MAGPVTELDTEWTRPQAMHRPRAPERQQRAGGSSRSPSEIIKLTPAPLIKASSVVHMLYLFCRVL